MRLFRAGVALGLCVATSGLLAQVACAQPARPLLSLAQAQQMALNNHPQMKEAKFDVAAAEEAIRIARAAYSPQVFGSAVQAFAKPGTRISAPGGITDPTVLQRTAAGLNVSQYVTDFGRTADLVQSYQLAQKAQSEQSELTRDSVLLDVTQAYFEVLRSRALLKVALKTQQSRNTLLRQVSVLQRAGLRSTLDVSIAQRDVSAADQMVLEAKARRLDSYASLSETLGLEDEPNFKVVDVRALPQIPKSLAPLLDEALHDNHELAEQKALADAASKSADAARKLNDPTVTAYGYIGLTPIRAMNQVISSSYATAGVAMNIPLLNGGALKAQARQANDEARASAAKVADVRNKLLSAVRVAFDGVQAADGNIATTEQLVRTAREAYDLTNARYRIGLNSIVDLSDAQLNETQAEISHANAIYDYIEQGAALDFVTGMLAPAA